MRKAPNATAVIARKMKPVVSSVRSLNRIKSLRQRGEAD
jgi:hypothetical protein